MEFRHTLGTRLLGCIAVNRRQSFRNVSGDVVRTIGEDDSMSMVRKFDRNVNFNGVKITTNTTIFFSFLSCRMWPL